MNNRKHWSIREVAALTGIAEHRISYAHRSGKIPEPNHVAGKRIYSRAEVNRIANYFGVRLAKEGTWTSAP